MDHGQLKVLIVDDELHVRDLLGEAFLQRGITAIKFSSGEEALSFPELSSVDVALIDINLGSAMNGHAIALEFARLYPHIATILMSGLARLEDAIAALTEQVFAFVTKPFSSLVEVVILAERAAQSKRLERQNADYAQALMEHNLDLERRVEAATGNVRRYERMLSHLFATSYRLGELQSTVAVLDAVCRTIAEADICRRSVILLGDPKFLIRFTGSHSDLSDREQLRRITSALIGTPLRPYDFLRDETVLGGAIISHIRSIPADPGLQNADQKPAATLIIPLSRPDGSIAGFLSATDSPESGDPPAAIAQMLEVLLKHAVLQVEAIDLRDQLHRRHEELERRVLERTAELRNSQDAFSRLVSSTSDVVYLTDESLRIIYLNEAFTTVLGYPRENFVGRTLPNVLDELMTEAPGNRDAAVRLYSLTNDRELITLELHAGNGAARTFEINRTLVRQGGELKGTQGIARDTTERTLLLDQLLAAERLAVTGRIAAGVAHEINNPLQAIVSQINAVRAKLDAGDSPRENLQLVQDALDRIRQIVRGMLDLNRPASRSETELQLNMIVQSVMALMAPEAKQRRVSVSLHLDSNLPVIRGANTELQQAIMNVLLNAFEAMPEGGDVSISTSSRDQIAELIVKDSGTGIAAADLTKVFEPFYSKRANGQGSGLGLFITKTIVDLHRGTIAIASEPGKGTTCTLQFPAA